MTTVELLGVPVREWMRLQEHTDALMREYRLILQQPEGTVPAELMKLFADVAAAFPESAVPELRMGVKEAFEAGRLVADVQAVVTARQSELMLSLHRLLLEIDRYCRDGLLLTLPLEPEISGLRAWVVEEVARQLAGAAARRFDGPTLQ